MESLTLKKRLSLYTRSRRLLCQNGFYLEIRKDGIVQGTDDRNSPFSVLHVLSIGENMLTMWGAKAEAYLAVDHDGYVYTTKTEGHQCVFVELFTKDFFNVYGCFQSVKEGRPKCLNILATGSAEMRDFFGVPTNSCQFFWEMLSV
eukprot:Seg984.6 transcript_id=Seg984.6/GoldUCD/mRNA.D3Y31 product="Fibroblast growth factor 9" protein_id=Seg984.6/GoldUCD/D3Y31